MNAELFFQEFTPLSTNKERSYSGSNNTGRDNQLRKISFIIGEIFVSPSLVNNIYELVRDFHVTSLNLGNLFLNAVKVTQAILFYSPLGNICLSSFDERSNNIYLVDELEIKKRQCVEKFINQFEPELLKRYFQAKRIENDDTKKIEYMCEKLKGGCCFGYSMALLSKMKRHAKSSSKALKNSINIENVVYYQLVNNVLWSLRRSKEFSCSPAAYFNYQQLPEKKPAFAEFVNDFEKQKIANLFKYERLFFNFCGLNQKNAYIHDMEYYLKLDEMQLSDLSEEFNLAVLSIFEQSKGIHNVDEMTVAGYFYIHRPKNESRKGSAHAIFFQITDGYYRFYDSATPAHDFFEFSSLDLMLKGVKLHMETQRKSYKKGGFQLVLVGIPH